MSTEPTIPPIYARILSWCDRRPRRANALARRLLEQATPGSIDQAWAQLTLGWCLLARADVTAATAVLTLAREQFARASIAAGEIRARHGLAFAAFLYGAGAEEQATWAALAADLEAIGDRQAAILAQITRLRHLNQLGRSHEVIVQAEALAPLVASNGGRAEQALFERTRGIAHLQVGDFAAAAEALTRAAEGFAAARHPVELARTWFELARLAHMQGNYTEALALHQRTRAIFARLPLPLWVAFCDKAIGATEMKLGRPDRAIAAQLSARAAFIAMQAPAQIADCDLNLGNAAFYSGLYELALAAWRRAERLFAELAAQGRELVARRNQAEALTRLGRLDEAGALLDTLIPLAEQLGARFDLGEIVQALGEVLNAQGQSKLALGYLQRAEALFAKLPSPAGAARARLAQGRLYLATGDVTAAEGCFERAARELAESELDRWRADYGLGRCAELRGEPHEALEHYRRASAAVASLRQKLAEAHASSALFREAAALSADALRLTAAIDTPLALLALAEQQRGLALQQQIAREPVILPPALRADYERRRERLQATAVQGAAGSELDEAIGAYLETLFHGRHAVLASAAPPNRPLDLDEVRAELHACFGTAWTVLTYAQAGSDLLAMTLGPTGAHCTTIPLDTALRRRLERVCLPRYRAYTYQDLAFQSGRRSVPWEDLAALGEQLIPPEAREALGPTHRLLIAPSGPLHSLPWAALRLGGRWLIEQAVVQLIPGLQIWADLARHPRGGTEALLVGVGQFGERAEPLPSAIPSLDLAERHWPGAVRRLEDAAATREALRAMAAVGELRPYRLIHLATHGQLTSGRGVLAHLKLADDDLLVDEVTQLQLDGALAVLVACEGARGEELPGDELLSLTWGLLAGGASDVIASLWQLYDLQVLPMLEPLYAALAAGLDAPSALAAAQRQCIDLGRERPDAPLGQPLCWASLCATGAGVQAVLPAGGTTPADERSVVA